MVIAVRKMLDSELGWANAHYAEIGFVAAAETDLVVVAEVDGVRAGLGRLVPVAADIGELGGIYVLPQFRGKAVARAIVAWLIEHSPYDRLFCIPFAHLDRFYAGFGFAPVSPEAAVPPAISGKRRWCEQRYPDGVKLLVREARAHGRNEPQ